MHVLICYRLGVIGRSIRIMRIIRGICLISQQRKHIAVPSRRIVSEILWHVFICYKLGVIGRSRIMRIIRGIYLISQQRKHIAVASRRIDSPIFYMFSSVTDWKIHPYENNKRNIFHISRKKTYSSSITENCFTNIVYVFICTDWE